MPPGIPALSQHDYDQYKGYLVHRNLADVVPSMRFGKGTLIAPPLYRYNPTQARS
jgi:hypothetical protein